MTTSRRALFIAPLLAPLLPLTSRAAEEDPLWAAEFQTPESKPLKLRDLRGQWLVVNFWATWCAPCIKELPDFDQFYREEAAKGPAKAWRMVGLAIDGPTPVRQFLQRRPVSFPIGLAGLNGTDLMKKLGNLRGGLPYTLICNPQGGIVWRRPGETPLAMLREQRQKLAGS